MKNKSDVKAGMLLTDTDSLTYKIETENVYENFYKNRGLFDFSNYSKIQILMVIQITLS